MATAPQCRICDASALGEVRILHEMMFGTRKPFDYRACAACGCLQIVDPPADMAEHYGKGYYSFAPRHRGLKEKLRDWLTLNAPAALAGGFDWYKQGNWRAIAGVPKTASILDVGCGAGEFLRSLRAMGYDARGTDPFIDREVIENGEVIVQNRDIAAITELFDVVMMHHSLEHVVDQVETLRQVRRALNPGGTAIIRVPVIDSWAADHFGENWAHLDPPRHFYLHSRKSLRIAAKRAGLEVTLIRDDYNEFGVRGSLHLRRGRTSMAREPLDPSEYAPLLAQQRQACASGRADTVTMFARA
ncbi:MAG: class I SAM-dependent methyltransferase [Erythrobacter sp.]|nr:MAG: class I SAM-dependent methyltransferase [Erythrobacter sp.]